MVELGHELAVGGAGGGEFFAAFFELQPQIDDLLFQVGDLLVEGVDVGWGAESGLVPRLFAKSLGQAFFQVLDAVVEPDSAFVSGEQVCLQRGSGDRRADALISAASATAWSSAVMTRWRRRAESAWRPSSIGWERVSGAEAVLVRWGFAVVLMRWPPR